MQRTKKLNIKQRNEHFLHVENLREEKKEQFQALAILYTYKIINLDQTIELRQKIINKYIKKRLKLD